jgi:ssDNA-binding replication factor A large subunit
MAEVNLTLWGAVAANFDPTGNPVVAIKGAKVSDFNGVSLSSLGSSVIQVLPWGRFYKTPFRTKTCRTNIHP